MRPLFCSLHVNNQGVMGGGGANDPCLDVLPMHSLRQLLYMVYHLPFVFTWASLFSKRAVVYCANCGKSRCG